MVAPVNERLYVALDVENAEIALRLTGRLASLGVGFKIGPHFVLDEGFSTFIDGLCGLNNGRFIDLKHLDIATTAQIAVGKAAARRFNFATVHPEEHMVRATVAAARDSILNLLLVTRLTSLPPDDRIVRQRCEEAVSWGCQGVVCSALEVAMVRRLVPDYFLVVVPGIRPSGMSADGHQRVGTARQAMGDGADILVVGRPVIESDDPVSMACWIIEEMR